MVIRQNVAYGLVRGLSELWKCPDFQDFTVTLGAAHFGCHRLILAACSDFFRGLFRSRMQETEQNCVTIKDISSETFELILQTIYTGTGVLTNDNVIDIWRAVHQLQIHFLISDCENFVINSFSVENYAEYFYTSNILNSAVVLDTLWPFVLKNCNSFFQTCYFPQLPMADLLTLIKSQDLETDSEDDVIHAILKWVEFQENQNGIAYTNKTDASHENESCSGEEPDRKKCKTLKGISTVSCTVDDNILMESRGDERYNQGDEDNRCRNITTLLSQARTCLASQGCLKMLINHPLVRDIKEAKAVVSEALTYQLQVGKRNGQWPSRAIHRGNSDFVHCIVNPWENGNDTKFNVYSLARKEWLTKFQHFIGVETIELAGVGHELYALMTSKIVNLDQSAAPQPKHLYLYQLQNGLWLYKTISLTLRSDDFCVAVVESFLYIFSAHEQTVWKLDPVTQQVTQSPILADHEGVSYVVPLDRRILVFYAEGLEETVVYCFDTALNTWTQLNNLEGPPKGMTSFRDDHFTYLLQSNGNLWRVVTSQSNAIDFELVVKLWNRNRPLLGAVTFLGELYIHGAKSDNLNDELHSRRSLPGVFSKISYIENSFTKSWKSVPFTLQRKYLL